MLDISSHSLHTTTFPCRVLPHSVIDKTVIQKREVIIKCYGPTAGLRGRVFRRKSPVARQVVKDFIIIGLGLPAQSRAVFKNHFLTGAVAQTKIWNIEVDLFEHTTLSSSSSPDLLSSSCPLSSPFTTLLARSLLPLSSFSSPAALVFRRWGGSGWGRWDHGGWGGAPYSTDCLFDEGHHVFKLMEGWLLYGVWNTPREITQGWCVTFWHIREFCQKWKMQKWYRIPE